MGHFQIQVFVSLLVIAGGACVALICDFLKRNNEQLRELTVELKVRREEDQRLARILMPQAAPAPAAPKHIETPAIAASLAPHMATPKQNSMTSQGTIKKEKKRTVNADALAAIQRGEALAGAKMRSTPASVPVPAPARKPEAAAEVVVVAQPEILQGSAKKDWGSMLNRNAQRTKPAFGTLPEGFQDGHVLRKLVESRRPVSGLVVSIGVNESSDSVRGLVQSLIGPNDFAAQSGEDEFLLIYPEERGASAQRKLNEIAEKLWDFQLRSLGSLEILFSWGGIEVRSESIDEAIASASERMQETKRGRKLITMSAPNSANTTHLRQAV